ncbi:hypothetical protein FACS1894166_08910 [Bacilli bacterium]|nr:hypothetical protein FACS1894166_08910 [Bacilli bacterium]
MNVIVITLLTIYATVTTVTVKTPGELANKHSSYVSTIKYLTNQGTIQLGAALSPIDVDNESNPLAFNDNKGQSEFWHQYMNESTANTATAFNVVGQFTQMNNLLGLGQYQADNSCAYFDNSRMFSYDFNNELSRKEPSCVPLFVPENDLGIDAVKYDNTNIGDIAVASMQHLIELEANQKIGVLGTSHDSTESEFTKMFDLNQYDFGVGYTNKQ